MSALHNSIQQQLTIPLLTDTADEEKIQHSASGLEVTAPGCIAASKEKFKKVIRPTFLPVMGAVALASGSVLTQYILSKYADLLPVYRLASGLLPTQTGVINIMLSQDIKNLKTDIFAPGNLRNTFWAHIVFGVAMTLAALPLMHHLPIFLKWLKAIDLSDKQIDSLHKTFYLSYTDMLLSNFLDSYLSLLYQTRQVNTASTFIILLELSAISALAVSIYGCGFGLESVGVAFLIADLVGIGFILRLEKKSAPIEGINSQKYSIFDRSLPASQSVLEKLKIMKKLGGPTWVVSLIGNIIGTYTGIKFSSISLQGMLGVLSGACGGMTEVVLDIFSPHIAETQGLDRTKQIKKQFLLAILPSLLFAGVAIPLARPLSHALGGQVPDDVSTKELTENVILFTAGSWLNLLFDVLYQTFIDCELTKTPALIGIVDILLTLATCFALKSALSKESEITANVATVIVTSITLPLLGLYAYKQRAKVFPESPDDHSPVLFTTPAATPTAAISATAFSAPKIENPARVTPELEP